MLERFKRFAQNMKIQLKALYLASRDPRTPRIAKCFIIIVVAYALSPIDLIPDFIPVLGYLDDLILLPLGIYIAIKFIPETLWRDYQVQAQLIDFKLPNNRLAVIFIILCWITIVFLVGIVLWKRN